MPVSSCRRRRTWNSFGHFGGGRDQTGKVGMAPGLILGVAGTPPGSFKRAPKRVKGSQKDLASKKWAQTSTQQDPNKNRWCQRHAPNMSRTCPKRALNMLKPPAANPRAAIWCPCSEYDFKRSKGVSEKLSHRIPESQDPRIGRYVELVELCRIM